VSTNLLNKKRALLGIAIPTYKREHLLARLLDSIKEELPIVVSDNGGYLSQEFKYKYSNIKFISDYEVSVLENWNRAANELETEWIVMPGDDDIYYPESFKVMITKLNEFYDSDIIFFGHHNIDEKDCIKSTYLPDSGNYKSPNGFNKVRMGVESRPPSIVFKSDLFHRLNGFCTDFKVTAGDNDFYQRAALIGNVAFVDVVVSGYRVWENGATRSTIGTLEWLKEIDLLCSRIRKFSLEHGNYKYSPSLQDDIYLANLQVGTLILKKNVGYFSGWKHFLRSRYPYKASKIRQLKFIVRLILPSIK
jgi:glycosyltransferase involved in cell wall biosynthesis